MTVLTSYFCKCVTQSPRSVRRPSLSALPESASYARGRLLVLFPSLFSDEKGRVRSSAEFELLVCRNNGTSSIA